MPKKKQNQIFLNDAYEKLHNDLEGVEDTPQEEVKEVQEVPEEVKENVVVKKETKVKVVKKPRKQLTAEQIETRKRNLEAGRAKSIETRRKKKQLKALEAAEKAGELDEKLLEKMEKKHKQKKIQEDNLSYKKELDNLRAEIKKLKEVQGLPPKRPDTPPQRVEKVQEPKVMNTIVEPTPPPPPPKPTDPLLGLSRRDLSKLMRRI